MKTHLKITFLIFFLIPLNNELYAQKPITWQRTYGDENINTAYSVVQTPNEGYIIAGSTRINTTTFIYAMRLNKYGDTLWTKTFNGYRANQIEKTQDGNYIILGSGNLIKININGDTLWTKPSSDGVRLCETSDNGFIICLSELHNFFLFYPKLRKIDSYGNIQWERVYTKNIYDGSFADIAIDSTGDFILTGNYSDTAYIWDYLFLMKTDELGNLTWFRKHDKLLYSESIIIKEGKYIIGGTNAQSGNRAFLSKFDSNGKLMWFKNYDTGNPTFGSCLSLINSIDGLAFTGAYHNGDFDYYIRLITTNNDGDEQWRKLYGFGNADFGKDLKQTSDTGFIIVGTREDVPLADIYVIKTDKNGYANPPVSVTSQITVIPEKFILYQNNPNPFNPRTNIKFILKEYGQVKIMVYDVSGKIHYIIDEYFKDIGLYNYVFDGQKLPSGIYFYSLIINGKVVDTKKMVLIK